MQFATTRQLDPSLYPPLIVAIVLIVAFSWMRTIYKYLVAKKLEDEGAELQGQVTSKQASTRRCWITFQYSAEGQLYTYRQQVSSSYYESVENGSQVQLRYLPDSPQQASIVGQDTAAANLQMVILFGIMTFACIGLVGYALMMPGK